MLFVLFVSFVVSSPICPSPIAERAALYPLTPTLSPTMSPNHLSISGQLFAATLRGRGGFRPPDLCINDRVSGMSSANAAPPWVVNPTNRRSSQTRSNCVARSRDRNRPRADFGLGNVPHQWMTFASADHVILSYPGWRSIRYRESSLTLGFGV